MITSSAFASDWMDKFSLEERNEFVSAKIIYCQKNYAADHDTQLFVLMGSKLKLRGTNHKACPKAGRHYSKKSIGTYLNTGSYFSHKGYIHVLRGKNFIK